MKQIISTFVHKKLLFEVLFLAIIIAVLHKIALTYFLYWITDWFDIIMHTLGGLFIALASIFIFFTSGYVHVPHHSRVIIITTMGILLIVGLSWELWEIWAGLIDALRDKTDSLYDLLFDVVGGVIGLVYYYIRYGRKN